MDIKAQINEEGFLSIALNKIVTVCGFCGNHDNENSVIEFNFREQKIYSLCSQCKTMNELDLSKNPSSPYPKTRIGR